MMPQTCSGFRLQNASCGAGHRDRITRIRNDATDMLWFSIAKCELRCGAPRCDKHGLGGRKLPPDNPISNENPNLKAWKQKQKEQMQFSGSENPKVEFGENTKLCHSRKTKGHRLNKKQARNLWFGKLKLLFF